MPVVCRLLFRNPVTNLRSDMNGLDLYTVRKRHFPMLGFDTNNHRLEFCYRQRPLRTLSTVKRRHRPTSTPMTVGQGSSPGERASVLHVEYLVITFLAQ